MWAEVTKLAYRKENKSRHTHSKSNGDLPGGDLWTVLELNTASFLPTKKKETKESWVVSESTK